MDCTKGAMPFQYLKSELEFEEPCRALGHSLLLSIFRDP